MELPLFNNAGLRLLVTFLLCFKESRAETSRPSVTISQGTLEGVTLSTKNNKSIFGFRGIPYAQPPIGDLRFKAPVAAESWNGTFDAGSDGPACIQNPDGEVFGSEDCLYINVYTPRLPTCANSTLLPVMVYIHGGKWLWGSNDYTVYSPTYLLDKDILFVIPNYRLGALGFLSTGNEVAPGNWGLKDQILALKWVQENIVHFDGDPDQVTSAGQSAGGVSVELLSFSDLTEGLYNRYITQSGLPLSTQQFQVNPAKRAFELGEYLGCTASTSTLLLECLRNSTATEITEANSIFIKWGIYPIVSWEPVVEPDIEGAVLTQSPDELLINGTIRDIPAIVGSDRDDGIVISGYFLANATKFEEFLGDFDNLLPYVLNYQDKSNNVSAITSALKSYYFNNDLTTNRTELLANLITLTGDNLSKFPRYQALQHDSSSSAPFYLFSFDYRGTFSWEYVFASGLLTNDGVSHSDELIYLFDLTNSSYFIALNETMSDTDLKVVDEMVELWTSFVVSGVPYSTALGNASWPRYSTNKQYLRIGSGSDTSLQVDDTDFTDKMQFWANLAEKYNTV